VVGVVGVAGGDALEGVAEGLERLEALGLGGLDHQRFVDDQREVDGGRVEAFLEALALAKSTRG